MRNPDIFIIGPTRAGKTTLAKALAERLQYAEPVSAGAWVRKEADLYTHGFEEEALLGRLSRRMREQDPDVAIKAIVAELAPLRPKPCIVEGFRDGRDAVQVAEYLHETQAGCASGLVVLLLRDSAETRGFWQALGVSYEVARWSRSLGGEAKAMFGQFSAQPDAEEVAATIEGLE